MYIRKTTILLNTNNIAYIHIYASLFRHTYKECTKCQLVKECLKFVHTSGENCTGAKYAFDLSTQTGPSRENTNNKILPVQE